MSSHLYIGKEFDAASGALGARVELPSSDLLTHGLIVGMTGSGKTGLAIGLIEEVLKAGIPVLAIDPKGDLGNLLLLFEDLSPGSFEPWIDAAAAARSGQTVAAVAAQTSAAWQKGLAEWGLSAADVAALRRAHEAVVFTPGSGAGRALNILQSLEAPGVPFDVNEEDLRDEIAGIVSGILGLLKIDADPLKSREYVLLANLVEAAWRAGKGLTLETLIAGVADPPFEKLGALPVESVFPRKDRQGLMMALNNLLASPSFESWREGEPLDVERLLHAPDGRPRLSIVYTAHLADEERFFVTALLLDKLKTWMRRQPGTTALRALVYMDEIFGYFPPHPANPPTKRPLLTLLKQARAQGVGVVLATQNPVDLDYKGLANIGTWLVGKLQTDQDKQRLRDGLVGSGADAAAVDRLLDAARKRVFLLHDVHRPGPSLLQSRWVLSYLRGPLTREEVGRLMAGRPVAPATPPAAAAARGAATAPLLPAPLRGVYLSRYGGELADAHLLVKYAVRHKGAEELIGVRAYPLAAATVNEILDQEPLEVDEAGLVEEAPAAVRHGALPGFLDASAPRSLEKALRERLPDKLATTQLYDPVTKDTSAPGETREAFAARLQAAGGGASVERLRDRLEKKRRELATKEQDLSGRKQEKWAAIGGAALSALGGLLGGRKRGISGALSGARGVLSKNRMESTAETRVEALTAEIAGLEAEIAALADVDPGRFEERPLVPSRTSVKVLRYDVVWIY
jgi:hypothetical protein